MPAFALHQGLTNIQCSLLISIMGITNLLGRITLGIFTEHPCVDVTILYISCYITAGVWSLALVLWRHFVAMSVFAGLIGYSIAAFGPVLSEVLVRAVSLEQFGDAYGFLMISMAAWTLLGAPSAGWLYDYTGNYSNSFYLGGGSFVVSSIVVLVPFVITRYNSSKTVDNIDIKIDKKESYLQRSNRYLDQYGSQPLTY
jgi:MFS family permease